MESLTSIKGQVAVVTGGTAGMGEATALRFGAEGAKVAVIGRTKEKGDAVVKQISDAGGEAMFIMAECAEESEVKHATRTIIDNWGRVDILVNTAGGFIDAPPIEEVTNADMRHNFDWNVTAKFLITRELVPVMKSNSYGRIVNISSVAGRTARNGSSIEYSTNEAAILGMTRRLAVELAPFGITINAIAPGLVLTPRVKRHPPEILAEREKSIPVGRMGKPEELAHAIWYLCTPGAAFTTGAVLDVNGGNWTG
ncbi:MAG: SDR family NAD(P)-dependent oxidoreductase [Alphaproteobacteria bacterium]|mgnify:FL=1|nr:SDR family NAD(P)-dependent oxidoreductase [Alphaproteobacteria bacterium]